MVVPSNLVYTQGTGAPAVTADNLNTFVQTMSTLVAARGFSGTSLQMFFMQGYSSPNDGGQGFFYWNTTTGTDDGGVTTIVPTGSTAGCWSRIGAPSAARTPQTISNASAVVYTSSNVVNEVLVRGGAVTVSDTFPSASAIVASMQAPYGAQAGYTRDLLIINQNSGTLTIQPGTGVTFVGNLSSSNVALLTLTQRLFKINITSSSTVSVYG